MLRPSTLALAAALALVAPAAPPLAAQQPTASPSGGGRLRLADYLDWEDVQDPQLAPDGKQVVYTRRWVDKLNDRWESSLWIVVLLSGIATFGARQIMFAVVKLNTVEVVEPHALSAFTRQ